MKKIFLILAIIYTANSFAQSPEKLSFQGIARTNNGELIKSQPIGMQISILQGSESGSSVYTETHIVTSNTNGLITLEIGTGVSSDDFSAINWANGPYFIKTETDPSGGTAYSIVGTSQVMSVPYALHANTSGNTYWSQNNNDIHYNDGFVGIGKTPEYFLDIAGNVSTGNRTFFKIKNTSQSTTSNVALELQAGSEENLTSLRMIGDNYDYSWWAKHGLLRTTGDGIIIEATKTDNSGGNILFVNGNTNSLKTVNMIIDGTGNVGIGTTTPEVLLDITDDKPDGERTFFKIENTSQSTTSTVAMELQACSSENKTTLRMHGDNYDYSWWAKHGQLRTTGDGLIIEATKQDNSGGDIVFVNGYTNNLKPINMIINGTGDVGIGTEDPKEKLQIKSGNIYLEDAGSGVIMKSPNGNCWLMSVDDSGNPVFSSITCP